MSVGGQEAVITREHASTSSAQPAQEAAAVPLIALAPENEVSVCSSVPVDCLPKLRLAVQCYRRRVATPAMTRASAVGAALPPDPFSPSLPTAVACILRLLACPVKRHENRRTHVCGCRGCVTRHTRSGARCTFCCA